MPLNQVFGKAFLSMCLVWFQLWPSRLYIEWIIAFGEKTYYKHDHKGYHHNQDDV